MARQGKCPNCRIFYQWVKQGEIPLSRVRCPRCGSPLHRTSYRSRLPISYERVVVARGR